VRAFPPITGHELEACESGELVTLTANNVAYLKRPIEEGRHPEVEPPVQPD